MTLLGGLRILGAAFVRAYRLSREAEKARREGNELAMRRVKQMIADAKAETLAQLQGEPRCVDDEPIEPIVIHVYGVPNDSVMAPKSYLN